MSQLERQFQILADHWHRGFGQEVKRSAIAFCLLVLIFFGACMVSSSLRELLASQVLPMFGGMDISNEDGSFSALALFSNNVRACSVTMVYGLLPYVQLSALALGVNAMVIGFLASYYLVSGISPLTFLLGILPHGIFELPALVLAFSMGLYVCGQVTRRCRHDETALPLWDCVTLMSWLLRLVLIPLLAVAAAMEAYVTPLLLSLAM